jgi:flagellar biosynthesis/type III secretory pathway protein FliH
MPSGNQIVVRFHKQPRAVAPGDPRAPLPSLAPGPRPAPPVHPSHSAEATTAAPPRPDPREEEKARLLQEERRLQEERAAIQRVLDSVTAAAQQTHTVHQGHIAEWRHAAIELAVAIATRLVHDRVKANDFAIETIVREATALLGPDGPFTVRLHPADLTLLQSRLGGVPLFADGAGMVVVTADPSQSRGNCRIDTGDTEVTSRLSEQLAAMREELLRSLGDAQPGS